MSKNTFLGWLHNGIIENWESEALSDLDKKPITYGETAQKITELHNVFKTLDVKKGDKIAVSGKNSTNWAITFLATTTYGAIIVPLLSDFKPKDIAKLLNHSESIIFFADTKIGKDIEKEELEFLKIGISLDDYSVFYSKDENYKATFIESFKKSKEIKINKGEFTVPEFNQDELVEIIYSSGTVGFSKGVMLSHKSLSENVDYARDNMFLTKGDNILSFLPAAHAYGCAFEFLFPFSKGCHITFLGKTPTPEILLKAFDLVKPKLILCVPLIVEKIYKKKIKPQMDKPLMKILRHIPGLNNIIYKKVLASLNNVFGNNFSEIVIGGAAMNHEVEKFLTRIKFKFTIGYGMTECGPLISYQTWDQRKLESTGKIVNSLKVKIINHDAKTKVGEICVKGDNLMLGYYKNEAATNSAIDSEGWLHTGDLGLIDENEVITIKGRIKNMILGSSGQNIYPEELESLVNEFPCVTESVVVERNGRITALIFPDLDFIKEHHHTEEHLLHELKHNIHKLNRNLPNYMQIKEFEIYKEEFEKTPKKNIKRFLYN
jgi:long-chain acyl-CoA synthetase